jgi:hypothetical protein
MRSTARTSPVAEFGGRLDDSGFGLGAKHRRLRCHAGIRAPGRGVALPGSSALVIIVVI